jgi:predicted acyltransferase
MTARENSSVESTRLVSIDFFRGITMFLLIGEFTGFFSNLVDPALDGTFISFIGQQFHHYEWHGLHFWDLIQPFFMFIVGVSLPFSVSKRMKRGDSRGTVLRHVLQRSFLLLLFGWALYCIEPGRITFRFQNVLAQLSVTYLVAYLVMRKPPYWQITFTLLLLLATDLAYRFFPVAGFNQPFTPDHNLGAWVDLKISGELSGGHWVSLNAIPTIAHTVWGVLAGQLIMSDRKAYQKVRILLISGIILVVAGYALDPVTPIIKRISTSSFVLVSGGYSILALCFSYWLIDVKNISRWARVFVIVGMNPLFIYVFAHLGGAQFIRHILIPFTSGIFSFTGELGVNFITSALVWAGLWYICYWMYRRKIFIKI